MKERGRGNDYTDCIVINTGIIRELQEYGITKEQLSNLKALADYMDAIYVKSGGKNVIQISKQLETYFGEGNS